LLNTNEGAVHIKYNFIHHNRHGAGFGYGVNVGRGGYALIERNVFDENRHAITGDSSDGAKDFTGYTARENLILAGGGLHCLEPPLAPVFGRLCWRTHIIDMHGDRSAKSHGQWCCGTAGETIIVERNTVLYAPAPIVTTTAPIPEWLVEGIIEELSRQGLAIKIRGNPTDKVMVDGNVFRHDNRDEAIAQNGSIVRRCSDFLYVYEVCHTFVLEPTKPIQVRPNNVFGSDPLAELGSCDFVGDGRQDRFMAHLVGVLDGDQPVAISELNAREIATAPIGRCRQRRPLRRRRACAPT